MRNGTQWTWHVLSTWYTTLKVLGVLRWKTWIIIVPLSISAGMMALLTGSAWYFAFGLAVASAIVCFFERHYMAALALSNRYKGGRATHYST
jgi:hypothetical protein